jgi:prepilin-type N-terminal cleavage/methylation domain-containing protein
MKNTRQSLADAPRSGFSLIELLVAISLVGTISVMATQMFILFMQLEASTSLAAAGDLSRERLERQFRNDVHAARKAEVITRDGQQVLLLSGQNQDRVEFSPDFSGVRRRQLNSNQIQMEDLWMLPPGQLDFEVRGPLVELRSVESENPERARAVPVTPWRFVAALGFPANAATTGGEP